MREECEEPDSKFYGKKGDETGFDAHNMG